MFIACGEKEEEDQPLPTAGAAIKGKIPQAAVSAFSGENAFKHVADLTAFGPRPMGSEAYQKSLAYLETELAKFGWKTQRQSFTGITPAGAQKFTNLLARFSPEGEPNWKNSTAFVIGSHLDTKLFAEFEFVGANDSGSSTGVLVEMARVLSKHDQGARDIELVFFDGEEALLPNIKGRDGLYGSRYYAAQLDKRSDKPQIAIVLDIVGDPNIPLLISGDSHPKLVGQTNNAAVTLGLTKSVTPSSGLIIDDHVPLMNRANLPVLHLIGDFSQTTYWHKKEDTLDKLTPGALENTGKLTLQVLHQITNQ